jgi:ubiquitin-protein ligase
MYSALKPVAVLHSQTVHENRIYSLKIHCGDDYPDRPPTIHFLSRVNLPFVSQTNGKVDPVKLAALSQWGRDSSIETILVGIRRYVHYFLSLPRHRSHQQYGVLTDILSAQGDGNSQQSEASPASGGEYLLESLLCLQVN